MRTVGSPKIIAVNPRRADEVARLLAQSVGALDRADVEQHLVRACLAIGETDHLGLLVSFASVAITDGGVRITAFTVEQSLRGNGHGHRLMTALLEHPAIAHRDVSTTYTRPMSGFLAHFGFRYDHARGGETLTRRVMAAKAS